MTETDPENRLIGYIRVSTYGQTLDTQLEQLRAAGCNSRNIYREKVTGARPAMCRPNGGGPIDCSALGAYRRDWPRRGRRKRHL